ncbi:YybS family protein [Ornithinibacillus halophilus]|uniref:Uncharacterized conserved protein YybS, DUF2232 family n=1 Tax=Ornithinibacillus halophilus TaxID=930117 RepID=A0A1M5FZZ5_9BACI|nr:YybS family protein [Ornithinibacillus halophilus]SHF97110.1 Uncharacterized conserved protein YybS, DUF2232 family [Ornithinibacillus halophilus]
MNQSKKLTDGALLVAIYMVILLLALLIPFIFPVFVFLLPVPFIIYAAKYDWKPALIMFLAVTILSVLIASILFLPTSFVMGIGGIMIGAAIKRKLTAYETWARGTVGFVFGLVIAFLIMLVVFDINITEQYSTVVQDSMQMSQGLLEQFGAPEDVEEQLVIMEEQFLMLPNLLPVGFVISGLLMALVSQWLSYKLLNRIEQRKLRFPKFHELRFPVSIIWIYFLALIVSLFITDKDSTMFMGIQNILMLAGFFMTIQGFSLLYYYFYVKNKSKAVPIIITIFALVFAPLLLPLMRILGIIDIGFGLRDRLSKNGSN